MQTRKLSSLALPAALLAGLAAWSVAQPAGHDAADEPEEEVIAFAKAPQLVRDAALKLVGAANEKAISKVIKEEDEEDNEVYEIEYTDAGVTCSAIFSTTGDLMEIEKGVAQDAMPAAIMAALKKDYPTATIKDPNLVQKYYYEVDVVIDGKTHEVKVDAAGNIEDERDDHADADKVETEKK